MARLARPGSMVVTIFADASFCHETKAAGWGCWIKNDVRSATYEGVFQVTLDQAREAELCALVNAVHKAVVMTHAPPGSLLVLQTDCMSAIHLLTGRRKEASISLVEKAAWRKFRELVEANDLDWRLKHVRGHQGGKNARSWVNEKCDSLAKAAMRRARAKRREAV